MMGRGDMGKQIANAPASKKMAKGGKLEMVMKGGKKVPAFAADGVGKMAKGGKAFKTCAKCPSPAKCKAAGECMLKSKK
jgi:hypothetical protein